MKHNWVDSFRTCPLCRRRRVRKAPIKPSFRQGRSEEFNCGLRLNAKRSGDLYAQFSLKHQQHQVFIARGNEDLTRGDVRKLIISAIHDAWADHLTSKRRRRRLRRTTTPQADLRRPPRQSRAKTRHAIAAAA